MTTEQHDEKLLDHNYDGIQELDNPLPRWWINLFYITVVFAIIYFVYYVFGYGDSLSEKHAKAVHDMLQSENPVEAHAFNTNADTLQNGKALYVSKCAACHKTDGGGLVGPNLTDNYWVNGTGNNEDIYAVISDGVPQKGMIAWKTQLSPDDIQDLVVYIQSLKNSKPANAKAAEGTLYK